MFEAGGSTRTGASRIYECNRFISVVYEEYDDIARILVVSVKTPIKRFACSGRAGELVLPSALPFLAALAADDRGERFESTRGC